MTFRTASGDSPTAVVLKMRRDLQVTTADMRYAGEQQKARIIKRTGRGVDVNGNPFKAYTPAYAKRREKTGRRGSPVDLTFSGRMLKAMVVTRVSPIGFVIGVYNEEGVRAAVHDLGLGHAPRRHFMGASDADKKAILRDATVPARARAGDLNALKAFIGRS